MSCWGSRLLFKRQYWVKIVYHGFWFDAINEHVAWSRGQLERLSAEAWVGWRKQIRDAETQWAALPNSAWPGKGKCSYQNAGQGYLSGAVALKENHSIAKCAWWEGNWGINFWSLPPVPHIDWAHLETREGNLGNAAHKHQLLGTQNRDLEGQMENSQQIGQGNQDRFPSAKPLIWSLQSQANSCALLSIWALLT